MMMVMMMLLLLLHVVLYSSSDAVDNSLVLLHCSGLCGVPVFRGAPKPLLSEYNYPVWDGMIDMIYSIILSYCYCCYCCYLLLL